VGDIARLPASRYAAILCRGVLNDIVEDVGRDAVFAAFAVALQSNGVLILDVREWGASLERKSREPLFRKRVSTDRGELTFTSITALDAERRQLLISERHELIGQGGERVSDYRFVMRCWERAELDLLLARHGFGRVSFFGAYDPNIASGATDRLVVVAQRFDADMEPNQAPDFAEAFPDGLSARVRAVLEATSLGSSTQKRSQDDIGPITLNGQQLRIPARIYNPEPDWAIVRSLADVERSIAACLFTRHHDGRVRERALAQVPVSVESWVAPFVIQLLGEYVIEVVERAASLIEGAPKAGYVAFARENPDFLRLTALRATSYWNAYYRDRFREQNDYPAFPALAMLMSK
jgi:hypothetical protein